MNSNVNLMVGNANRIKSGTMINVGGSAKIQKNIMHVTKIIFGILVHAFVRMVNI